METDEERILEQGTELMSQERWREAINLFLSAADRFASSWKIAWNAGWSFFKVDDYQNAIEILQRSTELAPAEATAWWALGAVQQVAGELTEAEANLRQSLALSDSTLARGSLALVLMRQTRWTEAEAVHRQGLELRPSSSARWKAYGAFLSDRGRRKEALNAYLKYRALRDKSNC